LLTFHVKCFQQQYFFRFIHKTNSQFVSVSYYNSICYLFISFIVPSKMLKSSSSCITLFRSDKILIPISFNSKFLKSYALALFALKRIWSRVEMRGAL
jgi:hypothetical protein